MKLLPVFLTVCLYGHLGGCVCLYITTHNKGWAKTQMIAFGLLTDSSSASFPCSVTLLVLSAISPPSQPKTEQELQNVSCAQGGIQRYFGRKNDVYARRLAFSAVHVKGPGGLKSNWKLGQTWSIKTSSKICSTENIKLINLVKKKKSLLIHYDQ